MKFPLNYEVTLIQEDFIEIELIENLIDCKDIRKSSVKTYIIQTAVTAIVSCFLWLSPSVAKVSLLVTLMFFVIFTLYFLYNYFVGYKTDFDMTAQHLIKSNAQGNEFFKQEQGFVTFYEDRCEFLTDEQRRYFDLTLIDSVKITKRLFIFVMKPTKEKALRGFIYMPIPKRHLNDEQQAQLTEFCSMLKKKYFVKEWTDKTIFD